MNERGIKPLRQVLEEAQAMHVVAVVASAYSMKEAANDLEITAMYLRKLRKKYGLKIQSKRRSKQLVAA